MHQPLIHREIASYLDQSHIRRKLGVDPVHFANRNFSGCSDDVNERFNRAADSIFPSPFYIAALLERGVRALIYVGANDWICNWV
jgi:carboxypeptidase C (cathepsin A)